MKSMLEICQEVADLVVAKQPVDLFDRESQHEAAFLSMAKTVLDKLLRYGDWQELTKEGVLRTIDGKTSYLISNVVPDYYSLINNTMFVKDQYEEVIGSITPEQWMRDKYFWDSSTDLRFVVQNGMFRFLNAPKGGLKIVFQYRSNAVVYDKKSMEEKPALTENTDIPVFDEYLVKLGIEYLWLKRSGTDYAESFNEFEAEVHKKFGTGLATKDINLAVGSNALPDVGVVYNAATTSKSGQ